jgi:hypothetical protein
MNLQREAKISAEKRRGASLQSHSTLTYLYNNEEKLMDHVTLTAALSAAVTVPCVARAIHLKLRSEQRHNARHDTLSAKALRKADSLAFYLRSFWIPPQGILQIKNEIEVTPQTLTLFLGMNDGPDHYDPIRFKNETACVIIQLTYSAIDPLKATLQKHEGDFFRKVRLRGNRTVSVRYAGYEKGIKQVLDMPFRRLFSNYQAIAVREECTAKEITEEILRQTAPLMLRKWHVIVTQLHIIDVIMPPEKNQQLSLKSTTTAY